jgi:tetratricopeptide (TPR) repeat protein
MSQVGYGIGNISTAEKRQLASGTALVPPSWPDSPWGRVAQAAWQGRCDVFADFLRPVLRDCGQSVTYLAEPDAAQSASRLSDIAFRTCLADREGPVELIARGLAALWFERELTRFAGTLPRDLESSETALAAVARRRTDPRAEANASAIVVRVLLEAGTLHERGMREARRTVSLWQELAADQGPGFGAYDLARLTDAASHLGLAAARYGDLGAAAGAWALSRRVAEQDLDDRSRIARADNNLAALAAERGQRRHASDLIAGVWHTRLALLGAHPQDAAAWRRLTVTERARADITRVNGQVVEGVRLAAGLLADRQARLSDPGHADIAEARLVLGQALLAAGHPAAARRQLEEAADVRRARFLPTSYRVQEDLIWQAKAALVLERPRAVLDLLDGQAAQTDWFRDRVSFRLGYTARRLLALARGQLGGTEQAAAALRADRERLADWPLDAGLDPLAADFDRSLAELALNGARVQAAADALAELAEVEGGLGGESGAGSGGASGARAGVRPPLPAHGWTLVLLGRAAHRLGDADTAARCFGSVTALAGIDPRHPVILAAHYDEALRCAEIGDTGQAASLLAPLLDRALLGHGRPALGEAHPLLARARTLAERLGIAVPATAANLDEASLDIDA